MASARPPIPCIGGARMWTCDECGERDLWREGWRWFGADGQGETGDRVAAVLCPGCAPDPGEAA